MMSTSDARDRTALGITLLTVVSVLTAGVGASFVLLPGLVYDAFGVMVYRTGFPSSFGAEETAYIQLAHSVMGALMCGWFTFSTWFVRRVLPRRVPGAWTAWALGLLVWFVLDTGYSALAGFWPNGVLNACFLAAFLPGLWLTRSLRN